MKKIIYLLSCVLMLLLYTCTMEEGLVPDPAGEDALKAAHGSVISLQPSIDGDDTDELLAAFALAKASGRGSTVLLGPGEYTIGILEIHEFDGVFKGSGKSTTKITNQDDLPCGEAYDNNVLASLVKFIGGKVRISDMTFQIKDGRPCAFSESNEANMGDLFSILLVADYTDNFMPTERDMLFNIENVDFIGGVDDGYGIWGTTHNTGLGIWCGPDFWWPLWNEPFGNGRYTISKCKFTFFLDGVEGFGLGHEAEMRVHDNFFKQSLMQLYYTACSGASIYVTNNRFMDGTLTDISMEDIWTDLVFPAVVPNYRTKYHVSGNVFDSPEGVISLYLNDVMRVQTLNDDFSMLFNVHKNIFKTRESGTAILSNNNMDAKIWNNKFIGTGEYGIRVEGSTNAYAENIGILNNNFQLSDYDIAGVYLGPYSTGCKVVGVSTDDVIDNGINNVIIGVKAHKNGPHAKNASSQIMDMQEKLMKMRTPK